VAGEAWLGVVCPLTTLEMWLRGRAHEATYDGSFVEHWLQALLFWQAPAWAFTAAHSLFGLAVLATWWLWPVAAPGRDARLIRRVRVGRGRVRPGSRGMSLAAIRIGGSLRSIRSRQAPARCLSSGALASGFEA
jgi:hypothetical protein